jgi:hypothetical protein
VSDAVDESPRLAVERQGTCIFNNLMSLEANRTGQAFWSVENAGTKLPQNFVHRSAHCQDGEGKGSANRPLRGGGAKLKLVRLRPQHSTAQMATKPASALVSSVGSGWQQDDFSPMLLEAHLRPYMNVTRPGKSSRIIGGNKQRLEICRGRRAAEPDSAPHSFPLSKLDSAATWPAFDITCTLNKFTHTRGFALPLPGARLLRQICPCFSPHTGEALGVESTWGWSRLCLGRALFPTRKRKSTALRHASPASPKVEIP